MMTTCAWCGRPIKVRFDRFVLGTIQDELGRPLCRLDCPDTRPAGAAREEG